MKPPIAVFDLDGTLVHTAPDLVASLNHALAHHGHAPEAYSELALYAGTGGRGMLNHLFGKRGMAPAETEIMAIIETFLWHYDQAMPGQSSVYGGAIELINGLRTAGFKTAVCTNKPQVLANKLLTGLNISEFFDAVCGADYFSVRKPDPKHLTGTINIAGGDAKRCVMFGDSQTDFDTAIAADIPIVGVTFGYSPVGLDQFNLSRTISHYGEINVAQVQGLIER
jgi:phosphoglycolate phosphatase